MTKEVVSTTKAPAAIGPYSQGIVTDSLVFVSGQLPIDPATGVMPEGIKDQARQSLTNVKAILEAAGTSLDKVVKATCFLSDIGYFAEFNEVYAEFFHGQGAPARSAVGVAALPKAAKCEIEVIAVR